MKDRYTLKGRLGARQAALIAELLVQETETAPPTFMAAVVHALLSAPGELFEVEMNISPALAERLQAEDIHPATRAQIHDAEDYLAV